MLVLQDEGLQQELRRCPDRTSFVALVTERAHRHGFAVMAAEVEAALDTATHAWIMRWADR